MKVLLFLTKGFETLEASPFIDSIGWAKTACKNNIELETCGFHKKVVSSFGLTVEVDKTIDKVRVGDYEALAIPGGFGSFGFYEEAYDLKLLNLIRDFHKENKVIATVCVAAFCVAKTGLLNGKKATTYPLQGGVRHKELSTYGVEVINAPMVMDDDIITSSCPQSAPDVAFHLLELLLGRAKMKEVKKAMGY